MTLFEELTARGLVAQTTSAEEVSELINNGRAVFYIGFEPTADSLTVGHFVPLILMKHLADAGNTPIILIGGATAMVGDPSGRTDMRSMMTRETINHNADCFARQMERFVDLSRGKMVNNADWLMGLNYIDFLRDVGVHFSVNNMLRADCYKSRLEKGLSFLEFNYMLMQGYDFYYLFEKIGCNLQCGGDDQWANMLGGTELIRRKLGRDAHVLTAGLLLTSDGKKMGKTAKGAVWLDPEKTSVFEFFQYFRNVDDADVIKNLKMLTFVPLDQIAELEKLQGADLNRAKELLAYEITALVHGKDAAGVALETSKSLFTRGAADANMPSTTLTDGDLTDGVIGILDLMVKCGVVGSKSDARRAVEQGGVTVDDVKIDSIAKTFSRLELENGLVIKRGKKTYHRVSVARV
ncbi:tyrosine--tRNA ligase 1 [Clostridia bacterium]|nr:tyrosine--tRNA ligase 1 [Clostridia bacterium]